MDWRTRLAASYSSAVDPAASKRLHMMALRSLVDFAEYSVLGRALLVANRTTWPISRTARQHARWILRRRQLFADELNFRATTRLLAKGPRAEGRGPGAKDARLACGAILDPWPN